MLILHHTYSDLLGILLKIVYGLEFYFKMAVTRIVFMNVSTNS